MARTCPNGSCRIVHPDEVGQCPECGASMSRKPDAEQDPNGHLFALRANAGQAAYSGQAGSSRPGSEPTYRDTARVKEEALQTVYELMGFPDVQE